MPDLQVQFSLGSFSQGFCWTGPQAYAEALISILTGTVPGGAGLVIGPNVPAAGDQDKVWARLDGGGYLEGIYTFLGAWTRPHPIQPNSDAVPLIWKGTEANLHAYDGGDGTDPSVNPPTDTTGAMWMVDHSFDFRIPIGAGTNSVAYDGNPAAVINPGDTGGAERIKLTSDQIGAHRHLIGNVDTGNPVAGSPITPSNFTTSSSSSGTSHSQEYALRGTATEPTLGLTSASGMDLSHENMPPYLGVLFCRRTARRFIVAS